MIAPPNPPARFERADPPEVAALRRLKTAQPDLGTAVDMQVELIGLYRRAQGRLSTPWLAVDAGASALKLQAGTPLLSVEDVAYDWGELRSLVRQISDLLRRFDLLEPDDHQALQVIVRSGRPDQADVAAWLNRRRQPSPEETAATGLPDVLAQVLPLANRPFLARAVGVAHQQVDLGAWYRPYCPFCGGDPELGVMALDGSLRLLCGCCAATWPFDDIACPHCDSRNPSQRTSLESRDGRYRLVACDSCKRYLKVYVSRGADRPVMLDVDTIATLPLDAVAAQRGYST